MKKSILLSLIVCAVLLTGNSMAQSGFYYQAAIRDAAGQLVNEQAIQVRINLRSSTIDGPVEYSEIHSAVTSPYGIINIHVGEGSQTTGDFNSIDWSVPHFIETEVDAQNASNFTSMGTTQILSVPVANYANTAGDLTDKVAWNDNGDYAFIDDRKLIIGSEEPLKDSDLNLLEIAGEGLLGEFGRHRALFTYQPVYGTNIRGDSYTSLSSTNGWEGAGNISGVYGHVDSLRILRNTGLRIAGGGGGIFHTTLYNLQFEGDHEYRVAGAEALLTGSMSTQPENAIVAGLIALDEVNAPRSYAGYFGGKVHITDNVGIGVEQPQRPLHIDGALRLNPSALPSSPLLGDIFLEENSSSLMLYTGSTWDTLNGGGSSNGGAVSNAFISNDSVTYLSSGSLAVGADTTPKNTLLGLLNMGTNRVTSGIKRNLDSYLGVASGSYNATLESTLGRAEVADSWSVGIGVFGGVRSLNYIDNQVSWSTGAAGGKFDMNCSDLNFGNLSGNYTIVGMEAILQGNIAEYPANAIIAGVHIKDRINTPGTHAAYIVGKTYHEGSVGIGVKQPSRALHINDVMRLEPRAEAPTDPGEGDIYFDSTLQTLRVYTNAGWRNCFE